MKPNPLPEIDDSAFESISETLLTDIRANPGENAEDLLYSFSDQTAAKTVLAILSRHEVCVDSEGRYFIDQETMENYRA